MIKVDLEHTQIPLDSLLKYQKQVTKIHEKLEADNTNGTNFCGWMDLPIRYETDLSTQASWKKMTSLAQKLQTEVSVLVVVGIGGSYLGSRAAIEMVQGMFDNNKKVEIIYCGHTLSATYTSQILDYLQDKDFAINVISKSGTTIEPAIAFRLLKNLLARKHQQKPELIKNRIIVTTDSEQGLLHDMAIKESYPLFVIPNNIGGRFSVLTPVGIFPMLVAGIDINQVIIGAQKAYKECKSDKIMTNQAYKYAVSRYYLYHEKNKSIEILASYEPQLQMFCEWWKQLFGESEGKDNKGLFPVSAIFTTDLHSLGQFIQEGSKIFFETIIKVQKPNVDLSIPAIKQDVDQLNYLSNKTLHEINTLACEGTLAAHSDYQTGNIPNIVLEWESMSSEMFGFAAYFFMRSCAMSANLVQVNAFNQPGVEIYKKNMFKLLGK